jgi:hypothetical protein
LLLHLVHIRLWKEVSRSFKNSTQMSWVICMQIAGFGRVDQISKHQARGLSRRIYRSETYINHAYTMKKQFSLDIKWHYSTLVAASKLLHSYS